MTKYKNLDASPNHDFEGYPQYIQRDSRDVLVLDSDELHNQNTGVMNKDGVYIYRCRNEIGFGKN